MSKFYLAGGTALALQLGHRKSYDLDFFGKTQLTSDEIAEELRAYRNSTEISRSENIVIWSLDGIKVDFVNYQYLNIEKPVHSDGLRMFSVKDIAAMKLEAIKGRGRKRDFYDIFFLLKNFTLKEILTLHQRKFNDNSVFLVLKSLTYFRDAENDPEVITMNEDPGWENVKKVITNTVIKLS